MTSNTFSSAMVLKLIGRCPCFCLDRSKTFSPAHNDKKDPENGENDFFRHTFKTPQKNYTVYFSFLRFQKKTYNFYSFFRGQFSKKLLPLKNENTLFFLLNLSKFLPSEQNPLSQHSKINSSEYSMTLVKRRKLKTKNVTIF